MESVRADHADAFRALGEQVRVYATASDLPFGLVVTGSDNPRMAVELRDGRYSPG